MALPSSGPPRVDAAVLADLHEQHYDRIARYIAVRTGDRNAAEDMAGDVFLRAVESLGSFQQRGIPLQAWLFRVAHNLVVDHLRRRSRRRSVPLDEAMAIPDRSDPPGEVEHRLSMERVDQAMDKLNPAQQEVISLRFMGGLSSDEAGAVMGRTAGAIRELQRTAIKALRGVLVTEAEEPG